VRRSAFAIAAVAVAIGVVAACTEDRSTSLQNSSSSSTARATSSSTPFPAGTFVMPAVIGMFYADIEPLLRRSCGWSGQLVKVPDATDSGYEPGRVVTQDPTPGQRIAEDADITLQFAA
jgi:beta-lactam-binding protein with PASTA domain